LFADAVAANDAAIRSIVEKSRVLVVGAAGSIGQAFVRQLVPYRPSALHLVDLSENALVELVRDLRSSDVALPASFETYAIDFGSAAFEHLARTRGPFDIFVNFSAMKHVRSERNVESLIRMIDTNIGYLHRYLGSEAAKGLKRAFSVSTDKTVRPANLMGATKNLMEKSLFSHAAQLPVSSARFANVAFSDGSLLHGFGLRLAKRQPIAAPIGIRRYLISHQEAGQLCLLACFVGKNCEVFFPAFDAGRDLVEFSDVARRYLAFYGMKAVECDSENEAKSRIDKHPGEWPCFFSTSDTSGEKAFEEFYRNIDAPDYSAYANIGTVVESAVDVAQVDRFLTQIERIKISDEWSKTAVISAIKDAVPELDHVEMNRNLDQKM
jgi:FlaA1/EpsC-like NDP-sugar epimerase